MILGSMSVAAGESLGQGERLLRAKISAVSPFLPCGFVEYSNQEGRAIAKLARERAGGLVKLADELEE